MINNKKGQGLSTNAIILIVLGVIVLVIMAVGFMAGWDKIAPWIKPSNNVDEIVQACSLACSSGSSYEYCSKNRTLYAEDLPDKDGITNNCEIFGTDSSYKHYGVDACSGLCSNK